MCVCVLRVYLMAKVKNAIGRCGKWVTFENVFKAVVLLMVWGLLSFPVVVYFASKEKSTSSGWIETISELLQTLEGNCDAKGQETDLNATSNCLSASQVRQLSGG